jgi:hypothetical protein
MALPRRCVGLTVPANTFSSLTRVRTGPLSEAQGMKCPLSGRKNVTQARRKVSSSKLTATSVPVSSTSSPVCCRNFARFQVAFRLIALTSLPDSGQGQDRRSLGRPGPPAIHSLTRARPVLRGGGQIVAHKLPQGSTAHRSISERAWRCSDNYGKRLGPYAPATDRCRNSVVSQWRPKKSGYPTR